MGQIGFAEPLMKSTCADTMNLEQCLCFLCNVALEILVSRLTRLMPVTNAAFSLTDIDADTKTKT